MDLISRKAVLDALGEPHPMDYNACSVVRLVKDIPTIDAAPVKHGKWFDAMVGELPVQVCDQCNTFFPLAYTGGGHHYCPNCGAKMDLEG